MARPSQISRRFFLDRRIRGAVVPIALLLSALMTPPTGASAASVPYSDRATFLAATGSTQTVTFEGILPPDAIPGAPNLYYVPFNGLPQLMGVSLTIASSGCAGNFGSSTLALALDGAGAFLIDIYGDAPCETLLVTLPAPVTAFGFDYGPRGGFSSTFPARVLFSNGFVSENSTGHGFIGITSDEPFTSVRIVSTMFDGIINSTFDNFTFGTRAVTLGADVDVDPDAINMRSHGQWATVYIELPGHDLTTIDLSTVEVQGVPVEVRELVIGDHDADGVPDTGLKVNISALMEHLQTGPNQITVSGRLTTGESFSGSDWVKVIAPGAGFMSADRSLLRVDPSGILWFRTHEPGPVTAELFDVRGRRVLRITENVSAGQHAWNLPSGRTLASGIYFCRLTTAEGTASGRAIVLR